MGDNLWPSTWHGHMEYLDTNRRRRAIHRQHNRRITFKQARRNDKLALKLRIVQSPPSSGSNEGAL